MHNCIDTSDKWLFKHPGRLIKNKSFWVSVLLNWALNQNWALIRKLKCKGQEKCHASKSLTKVRKFLPKLLSELIKRFFLFLLFKLAPSFKWAFNRTWMLIRTSTPIRNFLPRQEGYSDWALYWTLVFWLVIYCITWMYTGLILIDVLVLSYKQN